MARKHLKVVLFSLSLGFICAVFTYFWYDSREITNEEIESSGFDKPEGFVQYFKEITTPIGAESSGYPTNYTIHELKVAREAAILKKNLSSDLVWVQRGPVNVGGRTRTIMVDPDDPSMNSWFVGTAGGGIWKTSNGGLTWTDMTPDLPNLSTTTLCMASTDHKLIYAGTGEGYGGEGMIAGNGIFVSKDKGLTWQLLPSTDGNPDFRYVNKIWIDPADKNIIIAVTNSAILKSTDGGATWQKKFANGYRVQDIVQNPLNTNVLYAGVNTYGVIKSTNKGESWKSTNRGIGLGRRVAIAVSPVDTSYVFACLENTAATMDVYISTDAGGNWIMQKDLMGTFFNFHQAQGWYNSVIEPHPFNKNEVYVAGVYMGKVTFSNFTSNSAPQILSVDTTGTSAFLGFINFGGAFLGGGMSSGLTENALVTVDDFVSVELRFGPGKQQKAHRFTVPEGRSSGVAAADYAYNDYVDVPFEAWDTKNNRQLAVSFRDQERDGSFNLIERDADNEMTGREYIFIQAIPYDTLNPSALVTKNGGHYEKMMYFFWPTLAPDKDWDPAGLKESNIKIEFGTALLKNVSTTIIQNDSKNTNLHVDHHDLVVIPGASASDPIRLISANDGGVASSLNGGETWTQLTNGFITTQFYGVSKKPGALEYIGGMQDNGTWQSTPGFVATNQTNYLFRVGGDGFQTIWNNKTPTKIMASVYNNRIYVSSNSGNNWISSSNGINNDGPFLTKLSNSKKNPDLVFAVGANGVYRHENFGIYTTPWQLVSMGTGWTSNATAYSSMNIKVSEKDSSVVWAGTGMFKNPKLKIFLSKDFGVTFDTVNNYDLVDMGFISGMATHPNNRAEAFLLFSYRGNPKVLRTMDFGKSWTDLSGFGTDTVSSNGFPDVIVHDLLVLPNDTNIIWAGTEIGIFESTNNGASWHILDGNLPAVSVFQMFYQDGQIVVATYGRGIWTTNLFPVGINNSIVEDQPGLKVYPNPATEYLSFELASSRVSRAQIRILSGSGKVVRTFNRSIDGNGKTTQQIDISEIAPGSYFLEVKIDGVSKTARFIKQ